MRMRLYSLCFISSYSALPLFSPIRDESVLDIWFSYKTELAEYELNFCNKHKFSNT